MKLWRVIIIYITIARNTKGDIDLDICRMCNISFKYIHIYILNTLFKFLLKRKKEKHVHFINFFQKKKNHEDTNLEIPEQY